MHKYYLFFILLTFSFFAKAQAGKYSEDEIQAERKFVSAKNFVLLEKYDEALDGFASFLKEMPHNGAAAYEISKIYAIQHDIIQAIEWAKKSIKWDKENEWYTLNLIELYQDNNDYEAAAILFDPLIEKKPHIKYNYEKQGYLFVLAQMPNKAIMSYDKYIQNIGEDRNILLKKIALLGGTGQEEQAYNLLNKLALKHPEDEHILLKLGHYLKNHDKSIEAKAYFEKVIAINPNNRQAQNALKNTSSGNSLDDLISNDEVDIDIKIKKLYPYLEKLVNGETIDNHIFDLVNQLTTFHATDAKSHALAGDFSLHKGYYDKALNYYEQSLDIDKTVFDVWLQKMDILKMMGRFDDLEKFSQLCTDLYPYKAQAFLNLGIAQIENNKPKDAIQNLQPALMMSRKSPKTQSMVYTEMARAYMATNKIEKAISNFEKAIERDPENDFAFKTYSFNLSRIGKEKNKSKDMAEKAMQLNPRSPDNRLNYAYVLYNLENFKEAKKVMEVLVNNDQSDNCSILEPYGDILFQLGDMTNALIQWQKALTNCPDNKNLEKKISQKKL